VDFIMDMDRAERHPAPAPAERREGSAGTQSIRRALAILEVLASGRDLGVRLAEVTRRTGLTRPTAHRILRVLVEEGIVEQNEKTRRYAIGEQIPMLALARATRSRLLRAAEPHLRRAAEKLGDTIFVTVRTGFDALCVARRFGNFPVQVLAIEVGERRPLGVSTAGVAMLATLPEAEAEMIVEHNAERYGAWRMTVPRVLALVEQARERGYVLRERGIVPGTKAVTVAIAASPRSPLAALTVVGIDRRMPAQRLPEIVSFLRASAGAIEASLRG